MGEELVKYILYWSVAGTIKLKYIIYMKSHNNYYAKKILLYFENCDLEIVLSWANKTFIVHVGKHSHEIIFLNDDNRSLKYQSDMSHEWYCCERYLQRNV